MRTITHEINIVDKSGSMVNAAEQVLSDFNERLQQAQDRVKSGEQEILFSLVVFDGDVYEVFWDNKVEDIQPLTNEEYEPRGSTAFRDAIGWAIKKARNDIVVKKGDNVSILLNIISDGVENASEHVDERELQELIAGCNCDKKIKWTITCMGFNKQYLQKTAEKFGISKGNVAAWGYSTPEEADNAFKVRKMALNNYYCLRASNEDMAVNSLFSADNEVSDFTKWDNKPSLTEEVKKVYTVAKAEYNRWVGSDKVKWEMK